MYMFFFSSLEKPFSKTVDRMEENFFLTFGCLSVNLTSDEDYDDIRDSLNITRKTSKYFCYLFHVRFFLSSSAVFLGQVTKFFFPSIIPSVRVCLTRRAGRSRTAGPRA